MKLFTYEKQQRMRVDAFCFTNQGTAVMFSCSTGKNDIDVKINRLLGTNTVIKSTDDNISDSATEIALSCSYF